MSIFIHIEKSFKEGLPFVSYRKPNSKKISAFFQKDTSLNIIDEYSNSGFVFAPFNNTDDAVFIPKESSIYIEEEQPIFDFKLHSKNTSINYLSKENHIDLVKKGIDAINNNDFQKIVLSRKELVELANFDCLVVFKNLLSIYANAMVYVWFHPKVGLWLGATPETLVKIDGNSFETMSLAGTQPYQENENAIWNQKEIDEQQFVTDYIVEKLTPISESIHTGKTETIKAGSILHLKTKITGTFKVKNSKLIAALHPTPAVCGLPKEESKNFILKNELYKRSYYTGFIGELNNNEKQTQLFVNLRCMQIISNNAIIYIGGGITKDSIPEKEWEETVAKALVMKKVL